MRRGVWWGRMVGGCWFEGVASTLCGLDGSGPYHLSIVLVPEPSVD